MPHWRARRTGVTMSGIFVSFMLLLSGFILALVILLVFMEVHR